MEENTTNPETITESVITTEENSKVQQPKIDVTGDNFLRPERLENESYEQYKIRRLINKHYLKLKKMGQMFWVSKTFQPGNTKNKGFTYNKKKVDAAIAKYLESKENTNTDTNIITK